MHVWNALYAARWKYRTQKIKSPLWHHRTTLSGCVFAAEACLSCEDTARQSCAMDNRQSTIGKSTRMWANATREYRWRPLFNAAKFGWRPLLECRAVKLPRRESRWKWKGCPKLANRSQPLVARRSPYYEDMWRRYRCLSSQSKDTLLCHLK